jgi:hypothetical protein
VYLIEVWIEQKKLRVAAQRMFREWIMVAEPQAGGRLPKA